MIIDAHHHFWHYSPAEYAWINEDAALIRRDFLPADLQTELAAVGVDGVVSVQARESLEETAWLLEMATQHDFIKGVVGWLPLADPDLCRVLENFADAPKLKGVRHIAQSEPDGFLLRDDFNSGVAALRASNLVYDVLITERQLPEAIEFVDRHAEQVFVLDHLAKPRAKDSEIEPWRTNLHELARRENVFCKISGLVTEADWQNWTPDGLQVYFDAAVDAFGPTRLMFGSDWPVCLLASDYRRWIETVRVWAAPLSTDEQNALFGSTAMRAYQL